MRTCVYTRTHISFMQNIHNAKTTAPNLAFQYVACIHKYTNWILPTSTLLNVHGIHTKQTAQRGRIRIKKNRTNTCYT